MGDDIDNILGASKKGNVASNSVVLDAKMAGAERCKGALTADASGPSAARALYVLDDLVVVGNFGGGRRGFVYVGVAAALGGALKRIVGVARSAGVGLRRI